MNKEIEELLYDAEWKRYETDFNHKVADRIISYIENIEQSHADLEKDMDEAFKIIDGLLKMLDFEKHAFRPQIEQARQFLKSLEN